MCLIVVFQAPAVFAEYNLQPAYDVQLMAQEIWEQWSHLRTMAVQLREDTLSRQREFEDLLAQEEQSIADAVEDMETSWQSRGPDMPGKLRAG